MLACLTGHSDRVLAVCADSQGHLLSAALDRSLRMWKPTLTPVTMDGQHQVEITTVTAGFDGSRVLSTDRYLFFCSLSFDAIASNSETGPFQA
jgi:hypothetical protein